MFLLYLKDKKDQTKGKTANKEKSDLKVSVSYVSLQSVHCFTFVAKLFCCW